ncbi:hypothetical protein quinque_012483 [Culex quinquefasciatus]
MPKRSKKTLRQKLAEVIEETSNDGKPRWNCKGNMEEELPCAYFQEKNFSPGNFKRHIVNKHPNIAGSLELDEPEEEKDASEPTPKKVQPDKVITKLTVSDATLDLTKHTPFINQFIEAFEPMFQLTNRLQKDHVPLTDFYSLWLVCQGHQHRIASTGNVLAKKLLAAMETRISKLKATSLFKACLLLDPRYNFKGANRLTGTDKTEAKRYLLSLNQKLEELNGNRSKEEDLERTEETNPLANLECRDKVYVSTTPWTVNGEPTHKGKPFSIIEYWKSKRLHNPLCYKLAMVIYSAPSTQVTVERLFSHLKFILTDFRNKLSSMSIKDIMLLRMNSDLLPQTVEMLLKQLNL